MDLKGIYPALVSPFNADLSFNYDGLRRLVAETKRKGVDGFYVGGSTAETFSLSVEEREKALETVIVEAGDCRVIAHVGVLNPADMMRLARHAASVGAAAVSSVPPFYYNHTVAEITQYYRDIIDASGLKVVLYNIPAFTGVTLNKENCAELAATGMVAGIKHTSHNLYDLQRLKAAYPDWLILSGHDEDFSPAQLMGAEGCIGSTLNFMPELFADMRDRIAKGDYPWAMRTQEKVNNVVDELGKVNFFAGVKHIMELQGIAPGPVRRPLLPLTDEEKKCVEGMYRKYFA